MMQNRKRILRINALALPGHRTPLHAFALAAAALAAIEAAAFAIGHAFTTFALAAAFVPFATVHGEKKWRRRASFLGSGHSFVDRSRADLASLQDELHVQGIAPVTCETRATLAELGGCVLREALTQKNMCTRG